MVRMNVRMTTRCLLLVIMKRSKTEKKKMTATINLDISNDINIDNIAPAVRSRNNKKIVINEFNIGVDNGSNNKQQQQQ